MQKIIIALKAISILALTIFMLLVANILKAQDKKKENTQGSAVSFIETSVVKAEEGAVGQIIGVQVTDVEIIEKDVTRLVKVNIPVDPEKYYKIEIIDAAGKTLEQNKISKLINDYENDNIGVKFYLNKKKNWTFKIKLSEIKDPNG